MKTEIAIFLIFVCILHVCHAIPHGTRENVRKLIIKSLWNDWLDTFKPCPGGQMADDEGNCQEIILEDF